MSLRLGGRDGAETSLMSAEMRWETPSGFVASWSWALATWSCFAFFLEFQ